MYSVIDISGKQYTVKEGDILAVDLMDKKIKDKIEFDKIVLVKLDEKDTKIGNPYVKGAKVQASVVDNVKDNKVITFKYKKRKNSKRIRGHRQPYTIIKINKINLGD
ncbi:MAG: 50S ribosomal protein L21 [Spirochaetes bacterium]|nr:50S ribosomal protein L21 [Spirochaetota bacterium]